MLDPRFYNSLPVSTLVTAARTYSANYVVIEEDDPRLQQLVDLDWRVVLGPVGSVDNHVLRAPWA
jgi:hypothetical protein